MPQGANRPLVALHPAGRTAQNDIGLINIARRRATSGAINSENQPISRYKGSHDTTVPVGIFADRRNSRTYFVSHWQCDIRATRLGRRNASNRRVLELPPRCAGRKAAGICRGESKSGRINLNYDRGRAARRLAAHFFVTSPTTDEVVRMATGLNPCNTANAVIVNAILWSWIAEPR